MSSQVKSSQVKSSSSPLGDCGCRNEMFSLFSLEFCMASAANRCVFFCCPAGKPYLLSSFSKNSISFFSLFCFDWRSVTTYWGGMGLRGGDGIHETDVCVCWGVGSKTEHEILVCFLWRYCFSSYLFQQGPIADVGMSRLFPVAITAVCGIGGSFEVRVRG